MTDILGLLKRARTHEIVAEAASAYYNNDERAFADELMELAVALKAILERTTIVTGGLAWAILEVAEADDEQ
jgi:hypothetical protein